MMPQLIWLFLLVGGASGARAASANLAVHVSAETAPAGQWVQFKISLGAPALVSSGRIVMDFDTSMFTAIAAPGVFGSSGDAYGAATISGLHLDAQFFSPIGGIGRLGGIPVLVVSAKIGSGVQPGTTVAINADASQAPWRDPGENVHFVSVTPGSLTVGGSVSIQPTYSGGGPLPAGFVFDLAGGGFSAATTVSIDGVAFSASYDSAYQAMAVTLEAPADLTGKRIVAKNPDGSEADEYSVPTWPYSTTPAIPALQGVQPMFPEKAWALPLTARFGYVGGAVAIQNPNNLPVQVHLETYPNCCGPYYVAVDETDTIGGWGFYSGGDDSTMVITASLPIQALQFNPCGLQEPDWPFPRTHLRSRDTPERPLRRNT